MNMKNHLQRVITLRLYTLVFCIIVPFFLLLMYTWTHRQDLSLYEFNPRKEEGGGEMIFFGKSKNKKASKIFIKQKTVLYWTKMFTSNNFYFGDGNVFDECPVWSCIGTNNRQYQSVDKFDAIMFHGPELNADDLPAKRSPHQLYIFMDSETQVFHPVVQDSVFNNFFNLTMAYRRDADIMRPYGAFRDIDTNDILPPNIPGQWINVTDGIIPKSTRNLYYKKKIIAAWFVSHCPTQSKRENLAKELQNYVTVDIYGTCGTLHCPRTKEIECYKKLESDYFFYLSFENSMCRDYITEKIYTVLDYNVIPIVYGAADYQSFLPPNSYINAMDFSSVERLAEFLVKLSRDEERYLSYFKWKNYYQTVHRTTYITCEFCKVLHEPRKPNQVVENIYDWWINGSQCIEPPLIT